MTRLIGFAAVLLIASVSFGGDLLPIVFEDQAMRSGSRQVKYDQYYILLGDNGSLERGDVLQITQRHGDRKHYGIVKGRFIAHDDLDRITIYWPALKGQKVGEVEQARLTVIDSRSLRISYEILDHDDRSQVGQKHRARIVDFQQLPKWVRSATGPSIIAKLPPAQRLLYHRMQAEQLRTSSEIIQMYLDSI